MRAWILSLALAGGLLPAAPAAAQDLDAADGGRGFLASRIEGLLSGAGREVRIEGFEGALSSRATIDRLTIADDEGVWLSIDDAVLDWDRSALLSRRLEVETLTAASITLLRIPQGEERLEPPRATARAFALPELPVAIEIGRVAADRVTLGEAVLGTQAVLALEGSGRLSDGTAQATIEAQRLDGAEGRFDLAARFDPEAGGLDLDLALAEGHGGIAASALGIPGEPALTLEAEAAGQLTDFTARFDLAADGAERLSGTVALEETEAGRRFALDAEGDVAPLLAPESRDFFGDDLVVAVEGIQGEDGGFALSRLDVATAELSVQGSADLAPGGVPEAFDLRLVIENGPDGVVLPVGGVRVGAADLTARFDAAQGEAWTLEGTLDGLSTEGFALGSLALDGGGTISPEARRVEGRATLAATGIEAGDAGLARALGEALTLNVEAAWTAGAPVDLRALRLAGEGLSVEAEGIVEGAAFDGVIEARVDDLSRLGEVTGADLGGAIEARVEGRVAPLSGAFDARVTATGRDLSTGIEAADALIGGTADLVLDAARDTEGTDIRAFTIETEALEARVEGRIAPQAEESVRLSYTARLDEVGRVVEQVSGPATLEGTAQRTGPLGAVEGAEATEGEAQAEVGRWRVTLDARAPQETAVTLFALVPDEGPAEVDFEARVGDLEPYVAALPGPAAVEGRATRTEGDWTARLTAELPQEIMAQVSATVPEGGTATANFDARVGDLGAFVPQLPGQATLMGRLAREDEGRIEVVATAMLPEGIEAEVTAEVPTEGSATAAFDARVPDMAAFVEALPGPATLSGTATRDETGIEAEFDLEAPQGIAAAVEATLPAEGPGMVRFDARIAEVGAFTDLVEGPAALTGTAMRDPEETLVNATITAPEGIEGTIDARLAGGVTEADLSAEIPDLATLVPALEGPATLDATVRREEGSTAVTADLSTEAGIEAEIDATLPPEGPIEARYAARVADVSTLAPLPQGPAELTGTARRTPEGDLTTQASLTAPAGLSADLDAALLASGDIEARLDAVLSEPEALREGLPGPIMATVLARREAGAWTADADVMAPGEASAALDVSLPPEGEALIDFDLRLPEPEAYLNGLPGPLTATGTARRGEAGWTADIDAAAADGSRLVADTTLPDEGRAEIAFDVGLADLGRLIPQLPGEATARGEATREDGTWRAQAQVSAPAGIEGTLEGSLAPDGDAEVDFDLGVGDLGRLVPQLPGEATAEGTATREGGVFGIDLDATGPSGTRAAIEGTYDPEGPVDLAFDLALGDVAVLVPRLSGPVAAQGTVTSEGGPLAVEAAVDGPGGSLTQVSGSVARDLATADLSASGTAPLEIVNPFIRPRAVEGTARYDLALEGPLELASLTGTVTAEGARIALPDQRLAIEGVDASVVLTGGQAALDVTGAVSSGGRLAVSGPIALGAPFEADLSVVAEDVVIVDPLLYETAVDGQLSITGPLTGSGGRIAGTLALAQTEVRIPSSGFGGAGAIPLIEHRNAPLAVRLTRERARLADVAPATRRGTPQRNAFDLDLTIQAENRIFVRGRGLDAELGGTLRLTGTTADVIPVGQFDLIRGRLDLLGQRFTFDEGSISLQGDFVPVVRLVAITEQDDDQLSIILEGDLTDPDLSIVSGAGLPEDEAIARLLFGRDLRELSPLQAARLANAVAELSGRGGLGLVSGLREGVGLDDLDITSAEDGTLALRAGAYLSENIYTDLSIGEDGRTEINLNLDVTDDVTVKGRTDAEGESGIGIFFQRDY